MNKNISMLVVCGALAMSAHAADQDATMKADVLGRHVTSTRNIPKAYIKDVKKSVNQKSDMVKTKSLAKVASYPDEQSMAKNFGVFEFRSNDKGTMERTYFLNGVKHTESEYLSLIQNVEDNDAPRKAFKNSYISKFNKIINDKSKSVDGVTVTKTTHESSGLDSYSHEFTCSCSKSVVESCKYNEIEEPYVFKSYTTVVKNSNLYKYFIQSGGKGKNIGVSFTENDLPHPSFGIDYVKIGNCSSGFPSNINHGAKVARTVKTLAPKATLYGVTVSCSDSVVPVALPIDGYDRVPKIYIGNHSYGQGGSVYDVSKSRFIDDFVYNTRTIEIASAGNEGMYNYANFSENARGVNVISVGAVHNDLTYDRSSSRVNPSYPKSDSTYAKPEIANYADLLFPQADVFTVSKGSRTDVLTPFFRQTSSATPYTTATVALLLEKFPFYKWHPEVVKALLITSSVKKINDAEQHDQDNVEYKVAMGVPDGKAMAQNNRSRFWNGNNEEFFNSNGQISFTESDIEPNKKYRVAIAWLSSGTYVSESGRLSQDLDLYVNQNGVRVGYSNSYANPFEFVEFTSNSDRPVTITISRFRNDGGRVLLGYNFLRVPDEYQN